MNQHGFITLPLMAWGAIGAGVIILGLGIGVKVQTSRLESCKQEFSIFRAQVKVLGDEAAAKAKAEQERQENILKETEAKSAKLKSDLAIVNKRLRDERARRSQVPAAPAGSSRPDLACFDRTELESALRHLDAGVSGLVDEGSENTLRLKLSVDWAGAALHAAGPSP